MLSNEEKKRQTLDIIVYYTNVLNQPKSNLILNKYLFVLNLIKYVNDHQLLFRGDFQQFEYGPTDVIMYKPYNNEQAMQVTKVKPTIKITGHPVVEINEIEFDINKVDPKLKAFIKTYLYNLVTYPDIELIRRLTSGKNTPKVGTKYTMKTYEQVSRDYEKVENRFWEHPYQVDTQTSNKSLTIEAHQIKNGQKPFLLTTDLMLKTMERLLNDPKIKLVNIKLNAGENTTQIEKMVLKHKNYGKVTLKATGKLKNKDVRWHQLLLNTINELWKE